MLDPRILCLAAFLRALATGFGGVLLGVYLARLGATPFAAGAVVAAGLSGAAAATLLATFAGDALGRRRLLAALAGLSALGGLGVAASGSAPALALAAFVGMVNGMGRDRGASLVLEHAALPSTTSETGRTRAFAVYSLLQDAGHALGSLGAGLPVVAVLFFGAGVETAACRAGFVLYAVVFLAAVPLYRRLSPAVESPRPERRAPLSPESRRVLRRIAPLFALDSLGGGLVGGALVAYFFYRRFGVGEAELAPLFFGARVLNAASHLGAAWLAGRIGLLNTMVFTHVPSSLLLLGVAWAPTFPLAAALFLLREGLVEMDVPTRQSYVMAVVRPEERTLASGVTNLVRTGAWAAAPLAAGAFMQGLSLATPLVLGAGAKLVYDVLLWASFRRTVPPEECRALPRGA